MLEGKMLALAALLLAGCGDAASGSGNGGVANSEAAETPSAAEGNASAAAAAEKVLRSETVEAVFEGWEMGDYLWATLAVQGREPTGAFVGPTPIEHFLEAHKGKPVTVRIDTVIMDIPEAGGAEEVQKIAEASAGGVTAAQWWAGLSAQEQQAAEARMEEVLGGG